MTLQEWIRVCIPYLNLSETEKAHFETLADAAGDADELFTVHTLQYAERPTLYGGWILYLQDGVVGCYRLRHGDLFEMYIGGRDRRILWSAERGAAEIWCSEPKAKTTGWRLVGNTSMTVGEAG